MGNLAEVRAATSVGDVVDYDGAAALSSEIVVGVKPSWLLVETIPGQERSAAAHLEARRFGIFVPDIRYEPKLVWNKSGTQARIERGDKLSALQRMFVGYVFVFVWLNAKNRERIGAAPGVRCIVRWPNGSVAEITDQQVGTFRAIEAILCPIDIPAAWRSIRKRYGWRRVRQEENDESEPEKTFAAVKGWINIGDGQWIDTIEALRVLDERDENQSVAKVLGLAS